MAKGYARITLKKEANAQTRTFYLEITRETDVFLSGIEIGKDGDEIVRKKADVTRHIISKDLIEKRVPMVMNNTYAELEVLK